MIFWVLSAHIWTTIRTPSLRRKVSDPSKYSFQVFLFAIAGIIPGDITTFIIGLSDRLAGFAPKLTLDFISVVSAGMDKAGVAQRITCLQYMSPWVKNLPLFCNPCHSLYEHSGARLRDCIRSLIDLTISDLEARLDTLRNFQVLI